jgi:hypothetical protein
MEAFARSNIDGGTGMCTDKLRFKKLQLSMVVCVASLTMIQPVLADHNPPTCTLSAANVALGPFCNSNGTGSLLGQPVVAGQIVYYQAALSHNQDILCGFDGGQILITTPDGVTTDATPIGGIPLLCGSPSCSPAGVSTVFSKIVPYVVRAQDIGVNQQFFQPCTTNNIQGTVRYTGGVSHCDTADDCDPSAATSVCNPARVIGFVVEKAIACTTGQVCNASLAYSSSASGASFNGNGAQFCYRFIYRNTGTAGLTVTSVVDSVLGPLVAPGGLAPGDVVTNFSGPQTVTSTTVNTITARAAQSAQACFSTNVVAQASATATVVPSTISCEVRFVQNSQLLTGNPGSCTSCQANIGVLPSSSSISVVVRVTNTSGNGQNVVNGTVKIGSSAFNIPGPIAPGSFAVVTVDTIAGNALGCHPVTADVTFQGATTGSCPLIPTSCSNSLEICGVPCVNISKLVKCVDVNECLSGNCSTVLSQYGTSATGVRDAAFCYSITITNCGTVALNNVDVVDNQLGSSLGFSSTLAIGQSQTRFFQKDYPGFVGTIRNTATVSGQGAGSNVTATANALVTLLSPSITCTKTVSLNGGPATAGGTVQVPFGSSNVLTFAVIVRNNGDVDLQNVTIVDTGVSGCGSSSNVVASLAQGQSVTSVLCEVTQVICPPDTTMNNTVNVTAEVATNVCSINPANCQRIVASTSCNNTITLTCVAPAGCRTTGGGKQPSENTCPTIRYVTHGGQVGAPFGVASAPDCATGTGFNNPCIRGEFQHVRHIKGGLRGVFHAASNGNQHDFDSLMCACLPCNERSTNAVYTTSNPFGGCHPDDRTYTSTNAVVDGLCNPGDRICGPEPRRAPANKIAFSGVGSYTMSNGRKTPKSVVFRVDLEDRGEPGGAFPRGAKAPPDRYRMRIWFISGDSDSASNRALRDAVAVRNPLDERVLRTLSCVGGAVPAPDIDDGGDLDRGNRQIHPSTGATCQ